MKRACCCLCALVLIVATAAAPCFAAAADAAQAQATQRAYTSLSPTTPSSSIDYTGPGSCGVDDAPDAATVVLPPETGCGSDCALSLRITAPSDVDGTNSNGNSSACERPPAGWPVLFFYPG
jgi:hypothetical protein